MIIKTCSKCNFVGEESLFCKNTNICKKCNREYQNEWNRSKKIKDKNRIKDKIKTCIKCNLTGEEVLFVYNTNVCKKCRNIYSKECKRKNPTSNKGIKNKTCSKCNIIKGISFFPASGSICRQCKSEYDKEYRKNNPEKIKLRSKIYYENNTDIILEKVKKYAKENPEKIKAGSKNYRNRNTDKIKETKRIDYANNKEKIKIRTKIWRKNNRDRVNKNVSVNLKNRRKNDPEYRLLKTCGVMVGSMLRSFNCSKNGESSKYHFPFNKEELKLSVQNKFEPWMNWQNQGIYNLKNWIDDDTSTHVWNLDHWIPQHLLPYSSMEDKKFKIVWSLSNLRPISAKQNILENCRETIGKIYLPQEYKDLCILIELLKEIINDSTIKPELVLFYNSMIKSKEDYEKENDIK